MDTPNDLYGRERAETAGAGNGMSIKMATVPCLQLVDATQGHWPSVSKPTSFCLFVCFFKRNWKSQVIYEIPEFLDVFIQYTDTFSKLLKLKEYILYTPQTEEKGPLVL